MNKLTTTLAVLFVLFAVSPAHASNAGCEYPNDLACNNTFYFGKDNSTPSAPPVETIIPPSKHHFHFHGSHHGHHHSFHCRHHAK